MRELSHALDWAGTARSFSRDRIWDPEQLAVAGAAAAVGVACVAVGAWRARRGGPAPEGPEQYLVPRSSPAAAASAAHSPDNGAADESDESADEYRYDACAAWLAAGAFVSVCFIISWGAGVLDATFFHPNVRPLEDAPFTVFTAASFAVVLVGYWWIWPMGTVSYGRAWGWHCVLFGVVDGLAESQLFLCIWSAVELIGLPRYGTGLITFVLQGGFKANWDERVWNVYVAPAHNVKEWNKWKVLFVHVPNVLVTFSYFITYGNATLYCATQTLALIGSTCAMRFPSPFSKYTNPPLRSQVVRRADKASALLWRVDHWGAKKGGDN